MKWILIIILYGSNGKGAVDHVEFETQQTCEAAKQKLHDDNGMFGLSIDLYCFPKGLPPGAKVER